MTRPSPETALGASCLLVVIATAAGLGCGPGDRVPRQAPMPETTGPTLGDEASFAAATTLYEAVLDRAPESPELWRTASLLRQGRQAEVVNALFTSPEFEWIRSGDVDAPALATQITGPEAPGDTITLMQRALQSGEAPTALWEILIPAGVSRRLILSE